MPSLAVGTTNPGKVAAVKEACSTYPQLADVELRPVKAASGVSDQVVCVAMCLSLSVAAVIVAVLMIASVAVAVTVTVTMSRGCVRALASNP